MADVLNHGSNIIIINCAVSNQKIIWANGSFCIISLPTTAILNNNLLNYNSFKQQCLARNTRLVWSQETANRIVELLTINSSIILVLQNGCTRRCLLFFSSNCIFALQRIMELLSVKFRTLIPALLLRGERLGMRLDQINCVWSNFCQLYNT